MNDSEATVEIALRIPGPWTQPSELLAALPEGCHLTGDHLVLADGSQVDFGVRPADDQFAAIFQTSCCQPPTAAERQGGSRAMP